MQDYTPDFCFFKSVPKMRRDCQKKDYSDAIAKSHDHSFEVLQKSQIGNFSVVTLQVATLKIPDLVFFAIHPKFLIGTFGSRVYSLSELYLCKIIS